MQRNGQIDESNNDFFMQSLTNRVIESSSHRVIESSSHRVIGRSHLRPTSADKIKSIVSNVRSTNRCRMRIMYTIMMTTLMPIKHSVTIVVFARCIGVIGGTSSQLNKLDVKKPFMLMYVVDCRYVNGCNIDFFTFMRF